MHDLNRRRAVSALCALALPWAGALPGCGGTVRRVRPVDFTLLANDFVGGLQFIDGNVQCAINAAGNVAFVGTRTPPPPSGQTQAIFVANGSTLLAMSTQSSGYVDVDAVQLGSLGNVAFVATRSGTPDQRGVYRANATGTAFATLYEAALPWMFGSGLPPPPQSRLALSANDTLAFSTIVSANGALYLLPLSGPPIELRTSTGVFFNNLAFAVNNGGVVAMDMEYGDPNAGLRRGLLMFDTPGDTLATIETTLERVGAQAQVAINNAGQVAFSLDAPVTIQYFTPPLPGGGVPSSTLTVPAGVHRATPTPFGTPFSFTTIATPADGYSAFGKVALNDSGTVVFEANHNSNTGVFFGANAATDTIAITGEDVTVGGRSQFFSIVRLGGLNDANQLAIQTSDFRTTDQQIWRVQLPLA